MGGKIIPALIEVVLRFFMPLPCGLIVEKDYVRDKN